MVDDGRRRTDDGPWLYYKFTNEPKGSGELKIDHKSFLWAWVSEDDTINSFVIFRLVRDYSGAPVDITAMKETVSSLDDELENYQWVDLFKWDFYSLSRLFEPTHEKRVLIT